MMLKKIKEGINEFGILIYAIYGVDRLLKKWTKKASITFIYLFAIPVKSDWGMKIPDFVKKTYKIKILHRYDAVLEPFPASRQTMNFRFSQNAVCLLVKKNGEPAGKMWIIQNLYKEDIMFCEIRMPKDIAWDFDVRILDKYRGSPAFAVLWNHAFEYLDRKNIKWIYSRIFTTNTNSVRVHEKLGGRIIGKLMFIKMGNREICIDMIESRVSIHIANTPKTFKLYKPH